MIADQLAAERRAIRVTVVGETRRVDVTIPPATVAELVPDLVGLLEAGPAVDDAPQEWVLTRLDGVPLDPERSLAAAGVVEGELLYLRRAADAGAPAVVENFAEAVATIVDASGGRWKARHLQALLIGLGALGLVVGAATLVPAGTFGSVFPLSVAVLLSAAAACLHRLLHRRAASIALALAALPWYAVGGEHLVAGPEGGAPILLAAGAGAGLLVGALAAWVAAPPVLGPASAVALLVGPLAAGTAVVGVGRATPEQAAVALAVVLALAPAVLPGVSARAARLLAGGEGDVPPLALESGVRQARRLLGWQLAGAGAALVGALAVLAFSPDAIGRLLCVAAVLTVALRVRHHRFVTEVLPLALTAMAGATMLAVTLLAPGTARTVAALAVGAVAIAGAAFVRGGRLDPHVRRWLGHLELAANAALLPLALWAVGVFGAINGWAHGL